MKTKEKIIKESLPLFNNNTFESTGTRLIAEKADILEGSLWYHFNSKNDIVKVHIKNFLEFYNERKIHLESQNPKQIILGLLSIYEIIWDYRYLIRDSFEQISFDNPKLYKQLVDLNSEIDDWVMKTIIHARNLEILVMNENDIDSIVEISLIIGRHWLDYSMKKYPSKSNLSLRKKGINLLIKTFYPYLSKDSKDIVDSIYEQD